MWDQKAKKGGNCQEKDKLQVMAPSYLLLILSVEMKGIERSFYSSLISSPLK